MPTLLKGAQRGPLQNTRSEKARKINSKKKIPRQSAVMSLSVRYSTPHQETLSENGSLPTRSHWVVKNQTFALELTATDFELHPEHVEARLIISDQGRQPQPEEPITWACRYGKNSVIMDIKLNVLSSQFTNGLFHILIKASHSDGSSVQVRILAVALLTATSGNDGRNKVCKQS